MTGRAPWFFYGVGVAALVLSALAGRLAIDVGVLIAIVAFVGAVIAAIQGIGRSASSRDERLETDAHAESAVGRGKAS
jgi:hypothetical protein